MTRQQIRQCADIVRETVSAREYAALIGIPVSRNGFCQCPFHSGDHTGSLRLYDGQRGWHCFGCGASGDVVELAKRFFGLTFPQAIRKVADDAGIALPGTGQMTYDQARAFQTVQDRRADLERRQRVEQAIDTAYYDALGDYVEISREVDALGEQIRQELRSHPIYMDDEIATAPDDDLMDKFFSAYAAQRAVSAVIDDMDTRRMRA